VGPTGDYGNPRRRSWRFQLENLPLGNPVRCRSRYHKHFFVIQFLLNNFLGVWVVGNIGRERGTPWLTIAVSYLSYMTRWYFPDENVWLTATVFCAELVFDTFSKKWRRTPRKRKSFMRRFSTLVFCAVLYAALWSSYFYFNGKITDSNGDEIPVHEALHHFFTSPWWTDLKQSLYDTYQYAQHHGW
jgi:DnaJ family protein C protein 22